MSDDIWRYKCAKCGLETFIKIGRLEPLSCTDCMIRELVVLRKHDALHAVRETGGKK